MKNRTTGLELYLKESQAEADSLRTENERLAREIEIVGYVVNIREAHKTFEKMSRLEAELAEARKSHADWFRATAKRLGITVLGHQSDRVRWSVGDFLTDAEPTPTEPEPKP